MPSHSAQRLLRRLWPVFKLLFGIIILIFVARYFGRDFGSEKARPLWSRIHPVRLVPVGLLYLAGMGTSLVFWYRLLHHFGQVPTIAAAIRAYYVGQLGKYVPGKAWALALRTGMIRSERVRTSVAAVTTLYEVLTTMAGGMLLAGLLAWLIAPQFPGSFSSDSLRRLLQQDNPGESAIDRRTLVILAAGLFAVVGLPILPPISNQLVRRLKRSLVEGQAVPRLTWLCWLEGLLCVSIGWLLWGASLWIAARVLLDRPELLSTHAWLTDTIYLALAYVAGFVIPVLGGIGVREFFLVVFLSQEFSGQLQMSSAEAGALAVSLALLLRLVWTAAEVLLAFLVYWLPGPPATALEKQAVASAQEQHTT